MAYVREAQEMSSDTRNATRQSEYVIRNWLVRQEFCQSVGWGLVLALTLGWVYWWTAGLNTLLAAGAMILTSFWRYLIPVEYRITPRGLEVSICGWRRLGRRFVPWFDFISAEEDAQGLLLVYAPGARLRSGWLATSAAQSTARGSFSPAMAPLRLVSTYVRCEPSSEAAQAISRYVRLESRLDRGSSHAASASRVQLSRRSTTPSGTL